MEQSMRRCCAISDSVSEVTGKVLSWLILAMVGILCWEVFMRSVFNAPTIWAHELSQYVFSLHFAIGGAYALKIGSMVKVDIFVTKLSPRAMAVVDILTGLFAMVFLFALTYKASTAAVYAVQIKEMSQTPWGPPMYPLKIILAVGAALLTMQGLAKFNRDILIALGKKERP